MKKLLSLILFLVAVLSATPTFAASQSSADSQMKHIEVREDFKTFFDSTNVVGSIVVYDQNNDKYTYFDLQRCRQRFIPASTFKIVNSLIALETGVVSDENFVIKWDGHERSIPEWNKDQTLKSAFKYSAVWYYQEVARRVGPERMKYYIDLIGYGNKNIGGGIDQFWLRGQLRISQDEQVELLKRLYADDLPFSKRNMHIVKDIMIREQNERMVVRGKTGLATLDNQDIGWYVGYVERDGNVYFFATNIVSAVGNKDLIPARVEITEQVLKKLDII